MTSSATYRRGILSTRCSLKLCPLFTVSCFLFPALFIAHRLSTPPYARLSSVYVLVVPCVMPESATDVPRIPGSTPLGWQHEATTLRTLHILSIQRESRSSSFSRHNSPLAASEFFQRSDGRAQVAIGLTHGSKSAHRGSTAGAAARLSFSSTVQFGKTPDPAPQSFPNPKCPCLVAPPWRLRLSLPSGKFCGYSAARLPCQGIFFHTKKCPQVNFLQCFWSILSNFFFIYSPNIRLDSEICLVQRVSESSRPNR